MYIYNKLIYSFLVLFGVVTIIFILFNIIPSDPAKMMLGDRDNQKQLILINKKYHFDEPLFHQYLYYINDLSPISLMWLDKEEFKYMQLISFNSCSIILKYPYLRQSFYQRNVNVSTLIFNAFPNTFILAFSSILLAFIIGLPLGLLAASFKGKFLDQFITSVSVLGMSLPSFFSAVLIAYIFAYKMRDFTNLNITGSLFVIDDLGSGSILSLRNLILPTLTLAIRPLAVIVNLTRTSLIDEISSDYILLARSKGLSKMYVLIFHALPNSMSAVITATSGWFAGLLSGAVFVEYIFGWHGLGKLLVDGLVNMDFPLVMGIILVISSCFVIINILVDLVYLWLDPRVKIY